MKATLFGQIAFQTFGVSFNMYKAIGLLLPKLHYESASILTRSLWEHSLMIHYLESLPEERARHFAEFTLVEFLRTLEDQQRTEFESVIQDRLKNYRAAKGRSKRRDGYVDAWSGESVYAQAKALKGGWLKEYKTTYRLGSLHAHASPGAVLFSAVSPKGYKHARERDRRRAAVVGMQSMDHMRQTCQLLWRHADLKDGEILANAQVFFSKFGQ